MKKTALLLVIAWSAWACLPMSSQYRLGTEAEMNKKWDEAIQAYERASLENPREPVYRLALERAKLGAGLFHLQEARALVALGKKDEAKAEYAKSIAYNPRDLSIAQEARLMTSAAPAAEPKKEKIEFPIKLKARDEALQLRFPVESSLKSIFLALGKAAGISLVFDETFRDVPFSTDLSNMTFEQALKSLCLPSKNFYRIIDERTVVVIPDTPMKRIQYDVNVIKTFYLTNIPADTLVASLAQMLRSTVKAPTLIADKTLNWVTIRDTPQVVDLAEKLIAMWDKPKAEVLIDLEIMEVSRSRLRQLGMSFSNAGAANTVGLQYGATTSSSSSTSTTTSANWFGLAGLALSKAENYTISLPTAFLQFLETDSDTKVIAQPRIRGVSDEEINHKVGQKVPIPKTTFATTAAGGVNSVPITNYDQQDVGIEIKIKPTIHRDSDVTLACEIKITSLGGTGYADIPIINNREIKNVMRLHNGETNLVAGLLRDEERKSLTGVPGLKDLPLIGRLFGAESTTREQTDVILTITPYIVRAVPLTPEDAKAVWVDVETPPSSAAQGVFEENILSRDINPAAAEASLRQRRPQELGMNAVVLSPASLEVPPGREFTIAVNINSDQEIGNMSLVLNYNPQVVTLKDVTEGGLSRQFGGEKMPFLKNVDNTAGACTLGFTSPSQSRGFKGTSTLAALRFEAKAPGECLITAANVSAMASAGGMINLQPQQARIVVR
jgi:general secretion pathway protein D